MPKVCNIIAEKALSALVLIFKVGFKKTENLITFYLGKSILLALQIFLMFSKTNMTEQLAN